MSHGGNTSKKITFVVAGDSNFRRYTKTAKFSCEKFGYEVLVYDLGGLGHGKKFITPVSEQANRKIPGKPLILLDALDSIEPDDFLVWLDSDATLLDRIDEVTDGDYDIGVTFRKNSINAGVVFIRNTDSARIFLKLWSERVRKSDQEALNSLCPVFEEELNKTVIRNETKIKVFPCKIYNNFFFNKPQEDAKILHYKSSTSRHLYPFEISLDWEFKKK